MFIPIAESFDLIDELGEWVLRAACSEVVGMTLEGIAVDLTVNMSVVQLRAEGVVERVETILRESYLAPTRLWIEVTESVLLDDRALLRLHRLHDLGVHLVIDDFGTGFATFRYLKWLPVEALKIDTSFVWGLGINASDTAIVRSVINLGRELGVEVIAEGVETESQRTQLLALHCRLAQGWLFNRALSRADFIDRYHRNDSRGLNAPIGALERNPEEARRIAALRACRIMDTSTDPACDSLVELVAQLLATPMAYLSFLDTDRQWFKAKCGFDWADTPRASSFCDHALRNPSSPMIVPDALVDDRFVMNPLVISSLHVRSYVGVPVLSRESLPIGTLCALDTASRSFTTEQIGQLVVLAEQAGALTDLRRRSVELSTLVRAQSAHAPNASDPTNMSADVSPRILAFGALTMDLGSRSVLIRGRVVALTVKEFDVLVYLATREDTVVSRAELLTAVWHSAPDWQASSTVTEHIYRLRSKIEDDPANPTMVLTARGIGYRFTAPASLPASFSASFSASLSSGTGGASQLIIC